MNDVTDPSTRMFTGTVSESQILSMMRSEDKSQKHEGWGVIAVALDMRAKKIVVRRLQFHGLLRSNLSFRHACFESVFGDVHGYVCDRVFSLESLDRALESFDATKSPLRSYLNRRIEWAITDWLKTNHRKQHGQRRSREDQDVGLLPSNHTDNAETEPTAKKLDLDQHIHQLADRQQAAFALNIHPFYPMTSPSRTVVHEQASESGKGVETTEACISELEEEAGQSFADRRSRNEDRLEAAWQDVQRIRKEIEHRELRMLDQGMSIDEINDLKYSANATKLVEEVQSRYADEKPESPFFYDRKELECDIVRLRKALDRHEQAEESGPVFAPSRTIAGVLGWKITRVDMALFRARKKLKEELEDIF